MAHGFELVREQRIPELNTNARLYRHNKTGAQLLSMENDDTNKCFGINFFTPPTSSNGIAHIMEHSVLCGSRKYPLKEPFVELIKSSVNTFLNAITFADKTCYPVASQNVQDLYNLIDVYMDAVLYPRITPQTLEQEGWHYELESEADPLIFKGVVFNEMKGNYSSPDSMLSTYSQVSLFPDTHYGVDAGGDPKVIPDLTYAEFKAFHETYYHPSNALIFFYGDDDADKRLQLMDGYLSEFEARPVSAIAERQAHFDAPKHLTYSYDAGAEDHGDDAKKSLITLNWLLTETTDTQTNLGLQILAYLLTGTPASPLRKALLDSELGESLAGGGVDDQLRQMTFSTGLKGIATEDADRVEKLILDTLAQLADRGIEADMIEAALNTVEFRLRENNTGRFPRGLSLMLNTLTTWLYHGDPIAPIAFEAPLSAIKAEANQQYFEKLIRTYLLNNPHRTTVLLTPDATLRQREEQAERARLDQVGGGLTHEERLQIIHETEALKRAQETPDSPEALATLPTLTLADLDKKDQIIPIAVHTAHDSRVVYHDLFTNGIVYFDLGFDLHTLPQRYLPFVELFSRALLEIGTHSEDSVKLSQRIGRKTGGITTSVFNALNPKTGQAESWLFLRSKGTVAQVDDLLAILQDILNDVRFDDQAFFKQIVLQEKADAESGLIPSGHQVANRRLRARFNEADWANEQMSGVNYLFFLRELVETVDNAWSTVHEALEAMRQTLLNRKTMLANVTLDAANWKTVERQLDGFLAAQPISEAGRTEWQPEYVTVNEGLTIPAQVNYVAKGANLYAADYHMHGSQMVILNYLRTTWLWEKVRVQGGAYGGFATFSKNSGVFAYLSYRDPNLAATLDIYDATGRFLRDLQLSESELTRSIIGTIGQIDNYLLPDAKGYVSLTNYLLGETDADRQKIRDEVLATTAEHFKAFGEVLDQVAARGVVTVVGSADDITAANASHADLLQLVKVL